MANGYTNRLKKRLPSAGDPNWDDEWHDNERIDEVVQGALLSVNRVISGGAVTDGGGLTANWTEVVVRLIGGQLTVAAGNLLMSSSQSNWIYINASGEVVVSLTPPSGDYIPLALVDTDSVGILRIADLRPMVGEVVNKDASDGVPGLTLFKINFMNALGVIKSFFTNANTEARTYTFQDRNGVIADDTDLAGVAAALSGKAPLASPALTGEPTAPTAAPGTNNTHVANTEFVGAAIAAIPASNTNNDIIGGDVTVAGNTLTITPCGCWDSSRTIWLETTADSQVILATTPNLDSFVFLTRLTDGVTFEPRAYSSLNGPASDAEIDAWRQVTYAKNTAAGVTMPYRQIANRIDWLTQTSRPILNASIGAGWTSCNVAAILPVATLLSVGIVTIGSSIPSVSYDGGTTNSFDAYSYTASSVVNILPVSTIHLKVHAGTVPAHIQTITLRR